MIQIYVEDVKMEVKKKTRENMRESKKKKKATYALQVWEKKYIKESRKKEAV